MPLEPVNRPPRGWWTKMRAQIEKNPKYAGRSKEDKDAITAGIYQNYDQATKLRLRREHAGKEKTFMSTKDYARLLGFGCGRGLLKDFGGWTSQNNDWERGFREGERKSEDRQRGIHTTRDREAQFSKKQTVIDYTTDPENQVRREGRKERQDALRYRGGQGKEQHQGIGTVPVAPGSATRPKPVAFKPKVPAAATAKYFYSQHYALYMPFQVLTATKSVGDSVQRGDLVVEGIVSMPIKDLQGDVIELPALIEAKNSMVTPPHNFVWLDHESPYAKPQNNQETPPIGKFVQSKIIQVKGTPALWAKMVVNKMHPDFDRVAYELTKGFYNAFSMEFVPITEGLKMIGGKMANAISSIKYFATSLVRAPANEGAVSMNVYRKAFTNTHSQFSPTRVVYSGGIGQSIKTKEIGNLKKFKELEPEEEPEYEPEMEPELEPEDDASMDGQVQGPPQGVPVKRRLKDYDRETGSTAAERASTAIGEWGDPAMEKRRAKRAEMKSSINDRLSVLEKAMLQINKNFAIMGKALGLKGIDSGDAKDTIDWDEGEGGGAEGSADLDEQEPPEVKPGRTKPAKQRMISTFDVGDEDIEDAESAEVGGEGTSSKKYITLSPIQLKQFIRKQVEAEVPKRVVVRPGGFGREEVGVVSEQMRLKHLLDQDDGSLESQMEIWGI